MLNLIRLELEVFTDNDRAMRLYKKFGFEVEGTLAKFAFRDGSFVDAVCDGPGQELKRFIARDIPPDALATPRSSSSTSTRCQGMAIGRRAVTNNSWQKLVIVIAVLAGLAACVPLQQDVEQLQPVTLAAAGDISCAPDREGTRNTCRMRDTAKLVEEVQPDAVLVLGDAQYPSGSLGDFLAAYDANWGRFKAITYPVPGNHEYKTPGAAGFFSYFQLPPHSERSWYTFDLKSWRIYALDSNCDQVGGCGPGSPQYEWLTEQLESEEGKCSLAFWHHPRFSSGPHGNDPRMSAFWRLLDREGVDVVLSGHDHNYERFAPMSAEGELEPRGMRQFVVGTGGAGHYPILRRRDGSEAAHSGAFGVLLLQLREDGYAWLFRSIESSGYRDGGADRCH